jgi:hypothetical protein
MALSPLNSKHKAQILAGTLGRTTGHLFEKNLTAFINSVDWSKEKISDIPDHLHVYNGNPAKLLISYICSKKGFKNVEKVQGWWLGGRW